MKKMLWLMAAFLAATNTWGQSTLTLEQCYRLAEANYPLTHQRALITSTRDYNISNIAKGIYPQLNVSGAATLPKAPSPTYLYPPDKRL